MGLRDLKEMMVARGIWMLCVNDAWLCRVIATGVAKLGKARSFDMIFENSSAPRSVLILWVVLGISETEGDMPCPKNPSF
jgi:hypothetical protein